MYVFVYYSNLCICIPLYCMYVHIIVSVVGPNFDHDCIMVGERLGTRSVQVQLSRTRICSVVMPNINHDCIMVREG